MFEGKFFRFAYGTILILAIIFLVGKLPYISKLLETLLSFVFLPLLLGGFLYYLLRPLVHLLASKIKNRNIAISITFFIVIGIFGLIIYYGGSIIYTETKKLINYFIENYELTKQNIEKLKAIKDSQLDLMTRLDLKERLIYFIQEFLKKITSYDFIGIFSSLTNLGTIIFLIPFVLFYLLKDEEKIYQSILNCFPENKKKKTERILMEIDQVLSAYIGGQLTVAIILGILMLIGYLIIQLPNAFALASIAMVTSLIPILGPVIGILPAIFVALSINLPMMLKLLAVLVVAQYLEGNLVRPFIQGEKLNIHPLVVVLLVLCSIMLFGVFGALFAVPIYAVARIIVKNLYFPD